MNRQISGVERKNTKISKYNPNRNTNTYNDVDSMQPPPLSLDQIRSNTNIDEELGFKVEQPDDDEFLNDFVIETFSSEDETTQDDGVGEMQILLYHFMSI